MWEADFGRKPPLKAAVISIRRPDYRCAANERRRTRRRARVFTSVRTATRNFDLELAIAILRSHTQLYVEIERFR
jgi:hypothetical protein